MSDTDIGEQGGVEDQSTDATYNPNTVRGLVRFWMQDTECKVWRDDELDMLLWHAQYTGSGDDLWRTTGDTRLNLFTLDACPYHYLNHWDWLNWWDNACTPFVTRSLRYYVLMAAWYGWESAANDAALCARIRRTGLFETDTWTTYKAVQARAVGMKALAMGQSNGIVLKARTPVSPRGLVW